MTYFLYAFGTLIILYAAGLGYSLLLLPKHFQRYALIVAPWVGYSYLCLACWHIYYFGARISSFTAWMVLIPPVAILAVVLLKRGSKDVGRAIFKGNAVAALAIAGGAFVVISFPAFWHAKGLTTVSLGNNDPAYYAAISRFLSEFHRGSTAGFLGQIATSTPFTLVADVDHFGAWAFPAFAAGVLKIMPHQNVTLCGNLLFALTAAGVFLLLQNTSKSSLAAVGIAVVGFHPIGQWLALEGFFAQIAGMGLAVLIFWSNTNLLAAKADKAWLQNCALLTIFTCGLLVTYQHMLPFVWFLTAVYVVTLMCLQRDFSGLKMYFAGNIAVLLLMAMLCPQRAADLFAKLRSTASAANGWFIPFLLPNDILGFFYRTSFIQGSSWIERGDWRVYAVISAVLTIVWVFSLIMAYRRQNYPFIALSAGCVAIYLGGCVLAARGVDPEGFGGYKSFKLISFFMPFFGAIVACCLMVEAKRWKKGLLIAKVLFVVVLVRGYSLADAELLRAPVFADKRVQPEYNVLLAIDRNKQIDSINLSGTDWWRTMWSVYFLMHKRIYLESSTYYPSSPNLDGRYDLIDNLAGASSIVRVIPLQTVPVYRLNERFSLAGPVWRIVTAKLGAGWYLGEIGHVWAGKDGKRATIIVRSRQEGVSVRIVLQCSTLKQNDALTLRLRGQPLSTDVSIGANNQQRIEIPALMLHWGDNEIEIETELDPVRLGPNDPRLASYLFTAVDVVEL